MFLTKMEEFTPTPFNPPKDESFEQSLRPPGFEEFHGQQKVVERLMLMVEAGDEYAHDFWSAN